MSLHWKVIFLQAALARGIPSERCAAPLGAAALLWAGCVCVGSVAQCARLSDSRLRQLNAQLSLAVSCV
eukprot:8229318-Pyramimonas_sp.AAC.1